MVMRLDINYIVDFVIYRLLNDKLTHLKLQKILYYIEAWHLAVYKKSIIQEDFQAWVHGPVCREVFDRFKNTKGFYDLFSEKDAQHAETDVEAYFEQYQEQKTHILDVLDTYGRFTGSQLEQLTHEEDPWINARKGVDRLAACSHIISKAQMQEYYKPLDFL